ncbi:amidohydrolase family protein [Halostagnicola sp. A-GB9-2]|uniref:amidohydrolase family protein n=1 Tax=Halostagnicola sp. A-GB9-2 TaxID=3048066 RepID=UPI0024C06C17|nr:amidohydrolase family protein [Halostagnicola sp. A-GB9-2]MDJ1433812.1 amidohydrolase family protein [Halostagnicola sp. A-GB9-2]
MGERIDAYSHVITADVLDKLESVNPDRVQAARDKPHLRDIDKRLDDLEEFGVDRQVLTLAAPYLWHGADPEDVIDIARFANDEVHRIAQEHPDRFVPVATLPFLTGEYVDEFERCIEDLDMAGVQIFSHVNGRFLDDPEFDDFYAAVDRAEVPIWIHPQNYNWHDYDKDDEWIYRMFGWPFETNIAVARLVFNGILDKYENLEIVTHHYGGTIPHLKERMMSRVERQIDSPEHDRIGVTSLSQPVETYFERIYGDTGVSSQGETHTLECGYEFFGPENTLFAADYPYGAEGGRYWLKHQIPAIEAMDIPAEEKEMIFSENVAELLDL